MKIVKRILLTMSVLLLLATAALADGTAANLEELYTLLFEHYSAFTEDFTIDYTGDENDLKDKDGKFLSAAALTRGMAATLPNPDGRGGDIAMMNLMDGKCTFDQGTLYFSMEYMLGKEQMDWMEQKTLEIADSLNVTGKSDMRKVKAVYEFVSDAFVYDQSLSKFTDYEGLTTGETVCQGYALMTYRLLWALDIPCRIVTGTSNGEAHGWNIVELDGKWYYLDITWDDRETLVELTWNYFLKASGDFSGHTLFDAFTTEAYRSAHPMAEESYPVPGIEIYMDGKRYDGLIIRNGRELQLEAKFSQAPTSSLFWQSSDPSIVSVDEKGYIKSLRPGRVIITAYCPMDDTFLPAVLDVTAVDLSTCSEWASEELNSYYLRSLYPAVLCSDFQNDIARDEFAQLLYTLMIKLVPDSGKYQLPPFEDLGETDYFFAIIYTVGRGIFQGTSQITFDPAAPLTREQAAKLICVLLEYYDIPLPKVENFSCTDEGDISQWAYGYVAHIANAGIMVGDETGAFRPKDALSREEAAVLLERLYVNWLIPNHPNAK